MRNHIVHLTSAHPRFDTRIFIKQCRSLQRAGYDVTLIVADGLGDDIVDCIRILDVGKPKHRQERMTATLQLLLARAKFLRADAIQLHDPELLKIAKLLRNPSVKVFFDAHEDLPIQMLTKPYLGPIRRRAFSVAAWFYQWAKLRYLDGLIAATDTIAYKLRRINKHTVSIHNFPTLEEFPVPGSWENRPRNVVYVGGLSKIRGTAEIVSAMARTHDIRLTLVGSCPERDFYDSLPKIDGWNRVDELGFLNRDGIQSALNLARAGLVTLHPIRNYVEAMPVKMFEYMAAGLPVIASNFPILRKIIETHQCGVYVDPLNPDEIGAAIQKLVDNPMIAAEMGQRGRIAVQKHFHWGLEEEKYLNFYADRLGNG